MEYLVKQIHQNISWKDYSMECATLFHYHVNMFTSTYLGSPLFHTTNDDD